MNKFKDYLLGWTLGWGIVLTIGMIVLGNKVSDLEAIVVELVELQEAQVTTDEAILTTIENHQTAIEGHNESLQDILWIIEVYREDHVESIAEIYQGHIIPLRAFHMEDQ
jgi:hypothetical protein